MSRVEKFSRQKRKSHKNKTDIHGATNHADETGQSLPSRVKKHRSSKTKMIKIYYNIVFTLFVSLVIFLLWYGNEYYSQ